MSDIKWNLEKKKQREEEIARQDAEREQRKGKKLFGELYQQWKRRLVKSSKTPQEIVKALYDLQTMVGEGSAHLSEEAKQFALQLVEDKIGEAVALTITERNQITQYIPNAAYLVSTEGRPEAAVAPTEEDSIRKHNLTAAPVQVLFREQEELEAVPWVKSVMQKDQFVGLFVDGNYLCALFEDGEIVKVGVLANQTGVTRYPRGQELYEALVAEDPKGFSEALASGEPRLTDSTDFRKSAPPESGPAGSDDPTLN